MHPFLARYLDLRRAADTLRRDRRGDALSEDERFLAEAARADPERAEAVLAAAERVRPPPRAQEALMLLCARGATRALVQEPRFIPQVERARAALVGAGASDEEIEHLFAVLLIEEAFGYDDEVDEFDAPFLAESLEGLTELAGLTRERVEALRADFIRQAEDEGWKQAHEAAADELLQAAWADGPEPINPEHVEAALEGLAEAGVELARAQAALQRFLTHLQQARLIGPMRAARLTRRVDERVGAAQTRH